VVKGLAIGHFPYNGIGIGKITPDDTAANNMIAGNYIGVNAAGTLAHGNGGSGVFIGLGATNNLVGGDQPADRNIISGNNLEGVGIQGAETNNNTVSGNYIGTNNNGTSALANLWQGVRIYGGAQDNTIGGDAAGERNLISENGKSGIAIIGEGTNGNIVSGNYIGPDVSGMGFAGNTAEGVSISGGAQDNLIGGDTLIERNVISGNNSSGVYVGDSTTTGNVISGNFIGLVASGTTALPNDNDGVMIEDAPDNLIGGDTLGEWNMISGNTGDGIHISGSEAAGNVISGNVIGVNVSGFTAIPNGQNGVTISFGKGNRIGGDTDGERNVISGNGNYGIGVQNASDTIISGNYIGIDATGTAAQPNIGNGVNISFACDYLIGGNTPGERNVISGNGDDGVLLNHGSGIVSGNYIGTDASGMAAIPNGDDGVSFFIASSMLIGGNSPGERNVISGNGGNGIRIRLVATHDNIVSGNYIGVAADGATDLGNTGSGILLSDRAHHNTIGGTSPGEGNLIGFNADGIALFDSETSDNIISGNYIGTNTSGTLDLGNDFFGVQCLGSQNVIGPNNRIANHPADGIWVAGADAVGNIITQNSIFTNFNLGINLEAGGNNELPAPVIVSVSDWPLRVSGSACSGCTVEIFSNSQNDNEGEVYLGSGTATTGGVFDIPVPSVPYAYLTATATDEVDGTSEFSTIFTTTVVRTISLPLVLRADP